MLVRYLFPVTLLCGVALASGFSDPACAGAVITRNAFEISMLSVRNDSGEWISTVEGRRGIDDRTDRVEMDFKHRVVECAGKQYFHFKGTFGDRNVEQEADRLTFHPRCGTNVAISNSGRTIQKINGDERFHGVAFTNRPLKPNELFEVVVNSRTGSKFGYFIGIGITTTSPNDGEITNHLNSLRTGTWMLYHNNLYNNGNTILKDRQKHLDQLKVGDRVGVKRNESGSLFLVVNGKEEVVASNTPYPVYGGLELFGDLAQVTITS